MIDNGDALDLSYHKTQPTVKPLVLVAPNSKT